MQSKRKILLGAGAAAVLIVLALLSGVFASGSAEPVPADSVDGSSIVYFTRGINSASLIKVYDALKWKPTGKVAVKISTGEPPNSNYLRTELIGDLVKNINGTFVECNTAGSKGRGETQKHLQTAQAHGFTAIAKVDIQDANGSYTLPVQGGKHLKENYVGASFPEYGSYLILSHFKGHQMAGFGGAIKNVSIGMASGMGKAWIHSGGKSKTSPWGGEQNAFLESMSEACKSVYDRLDNGKRMAYINVMNRLSVDCDCNGNPAEPDMHDIGILASLDPVALDQACVDLIYAAKDGKSVIQRIESRNGLLTLAHAEEIGLGSRKYTLVTIEN